MESNEGYCNNEIISFNHNREESDLVVTNISIKVNCFILGPRKKEKVKYGSVTVVEGWWGKIRAGENSTGNDFQKVKVGLKFGPNIQSFKNISEKLVVIVLV